VTPRVSLQNAPAEPPAMSKQGKKQSILMRIVTSDRLLIATVFWTRIACASECPLRSEGNELV